MSFLEPAALFRFCPRCAAPRASAEPMQPFQCAGCGLHYYFNSCLAVAAILREWLTEIRQNPRAASAVT